MLHHVEIYCFTFRLRLSLELIIYTTMLANGGACYIIQFPTHFISLHVSFLHSFNINVCIVTSLYLAPFPQISLYVCCFKQKQNFSVFLTHDSSLRVKDSYHCHYSNSATIAAFLAVIIILGMNDYYRYIAVIFAIVRFLLSSRPLLFLLLKLCTGFPFRTCLVLKIFTSCLFLLHRSCNYF